VAEKIKLDLGSALPSGDKRSVFVRSGDSLSRLSYQNVEITTDAVYEALKEPCQQILAAAQYVLERTPPELAGDVMRSGIHLTGGGALLYGMERFFATELDMPVLLAKEPLACSVLGIGHLSENIDLLQSMITSQSVRIG
jgi:rod shape-determining protein MreB